MSRTLKTRLIGKGIGNIAKFTQIRVNVVLVSAGALINANSFIKIKIFLKNIILIARCTIIQKFLTSTTILRTF